MGPSYPINSSRLNKLWPSKSFLDVAIINAPPSVMSMQNTSFSWIGEIQNSNTQSLRSITMIALEFWFHSSAGRRHTIQRVIDHNNSLNLVLLFRLFFALLYSIVTTSLIIIFHPNCSLSSSPLFSSPLNFAMEDTLTTLWEKNSLIENEGLTINIDPKKLLAPSNA